MSKKWTKEDVEYLKEKWGNVSISSIANSVICSTKERWGGTKWGIYYSEVKAPKQINGAMEVFTYGKSDKYVF